MTERLPNVPSIHEAVPGASAAPGSEPVLTQPKRARRPTVLWSTAGVLAAVGVALGVADLRIRQGIVSPQVMVVDTSDSTLWATGHIPLASEEMDLTGHVAPKDVSPLALRTPVHVRGTLADPELSLAKGPLVRRAVPALLLGMLNPLAALLPLIDLGSGEARDRLNGCRALAARQPAASPSRPRSTRPGSS